MLAEFLLAGIPTLAGTLISAYYAWRARRAEASLEVLQSANATQGRVLSSTIERLNSTEAALAAAQKAARDAEIAETQRNPDGAADRLNGLSLPSPGGAGPAL